LPVPNATAAGRSHVREIGGWFCLLAVLTFCGEALGYAACLLIERLPPHPLGLAALAAVALGVAGVGTVLLDWLVLDAMRRLTLEAAELRAQAAHGREMEAQLNSRSEQQRRLRHDLRGALSPALLTADRLLTHADPAVQRTGSIIVRCVERATGLILESSSPDQVSPLADP
jgi:signal transduction histidine kinase